MLFDLRTDRVQGWSVVQVVGELDLATLPALRTELDRAPGHDVALDLSSVDYLDPLALGVVLAGSLRCTRAGGRFAVVCPPGRPRELLAETGLDRVLLVVGGTGSLD